MCILKFIIPHISAGQVVFCAKIAIFVGKRPIKSFCFSVGSKKCL